MLIIAIIDLHFPFRALIKNDIMNIVQAAATPRVRFASKPSLANRRLRSTSDPTRRSGPSSAASATEASQLRCDPFLVLAANATETKIFVW